VQRPDTGQAPAVDVQGITVAVWADTLPRFQRGGPRHETGVDDPDRRRQHFTEPVGR
jgi:hypothetical protein